jgi:hypothetical protein
MKKAAPKSKKKFLTFFVNTTDVLCIYKYRCFLLRFLLMTVLLTLFAAPAYTQQIYNQNFEIVDPCSPRGKYYPLNWSAQYSVEVTDIFLPSLTYESYQKWDPNILENGLSPCDGNSLAVLSSVDGQPDYAQITQVVNFEPNDMFHGRYFFGTDDYVPWNDFAYIRLEPNEWQGETFELVYIDVETVDSRYHTDGWQTFKFLFDEQTQGEYKIICYVEDYYDTVLESYLVLDNFGICKDATLSDINLDCEVNYKDYAYLTRDWGCDFSDPNYPPDPNYCQYEVDGEEIIFELPADLNKDDIVDFEDLKIFSDDWLKNFTDPPAD